MPSQTQPTPPSSNGASPQDNPFRVVRKRNRVPLSCAPCRHRKLKCNRAHPCDNCTKRGDVASCSYATPGTRKKQGSGGVSATPVDMQNRIDRLEGLVLSLMTTGGGGAAGQPGGAQAAQQAIETSRSNSLSNSFSNAGESRLDVEGADMIRERDEEGGADDSEVEQVSKGIGIMKVDNGRVAYASDAHWYAILGEINEVKNYFAAHKEDYAKHLEKVRAARADDNHGTAFLFSGVPPKDQNELFASFPSKADADRLIARYFNAYDPSVHIIHGPSFQAQYDKHWANPMESSVAWLGLCFAMMTLALQSFQRAGDEPPEYRGRATQLSHEFRRLTAQSLMLADITQSIPQNLETMILHLQAEYARSRDAEPGVLLMTSLCVRIAMRMGYHRDPGPHPSITPFQAEVRRRVFTFVRQIDLMISFQFGLPPMIRSDQFDTEPPRNIYDDELHENMQELPPSRPAIEATPMSYMITKSKMSFLFGRIVERVSSLTNPPSYEETMKFDQELRDARAVLPLLLQIRSFHESARDPANLIMQRLGLEMIYLRSLFVLHRRFIAQGRQNTRYAYSRRTCIDASMELLAHQATLHSESQPGGRLRSVKWYISSLTTHDFLVAAMLVCLDLYHFAQAESKGRKSPTAAPQQGDWYAEERRAEMLRAVEHCITIWDAVRDHSMEAFKASATLRVVVDKLKAHQAHREQFGQVSPREQQQQQAPPQVYPPTSTANAAPKPYPNASSGGFGMFPNGAVTDVNADDLPPEQSAAMTLGMLSSGGVSPGANFALQPQQQEGKGASFPAGMAGLLNEPLTQEQQQQQQQGRMGQQLTAGPQDGNSAATNTFAALFAPAGAPGSPLMGIDGFGASSGNVGDVDWGAWDNFIANQTAIDPGNMWPMNLDLDAMAGVGNTPSIGGDAPSTAQQLAQQQAFAAQQAQQAQAGMHQQGAGSEGVFMGGTPQTQPQPREQEQGQSGIM